ncbi:MAG: hypothetical protein AAGF59_01530, partial [Pseudomonadota bacterium]
ASFVSGMTTNPDTRNQRSPCPAGVEIFLPFTPMRVIWLTISVALSGLSTRIGRLFVDFGYVWQRFSQENITCETRWQR